MQIRRCAIVLIDGDGRRLRRLAVGITLLHGLIASLCVLPLLLVAVTMHSRTLREAVQQAMDVRRNNVCLRSELALAEQALPQVRALARQSEVNFMQLWDKSGLDIKPRALSVGPLELAQHEQIGDEPAVNAAGSDKSLSASPRAPTTQEMLHRATRLQQTLADTAEYFHDAQHLLANTPAIRPAATPWFTSSFGRRHDPVFHFWLMHKGLDLGGRVGMEIVAPADGIVIWTGRRGGYGQTVVLDHGYGLQTHFAHLNSYLVHVGDRVHRGAPIAHMGTTGKSTGPHLHYEVRRHGQPLDPRPFILD